MNPTVAQTFEGFCRAQLREMVSAPGEGGVLNPDTYLAELWRDVVRTIVNSSEDDAPYEPFDPHWQHLTVQVCDDELARSYFRAGIDAGHVDTHHVMAATMTVAHRRYPDVSPELAWDRFMVDDDAAAVSSSGGWSRLILDAPSAMPRWPFVRCLCGAHYIPDPN